MSRLRRRAGTKELLHTLADRVVLEPNRLRGRWNEVFGRDRPIHVELGMGKGRFISYMSLLYPEINFIGIDMYDELVRKASEKAEETRQEHVEGGGTLEDNLRLVLGNISEIGKMFAPGEIEQIYLNFSDPWPKTRHAPRRLTHPVFLAKYREILNDDGEIHLKTDSRSLFEFSLNSFAEMEMLLRNITLDLHGSGIAPNNVMTEYEMKFSGQGMNIHRCEAIVGARATERRRAELRELRSRWEKRGGAEDEGESDGESEDVGEFGAIAGAEGAGGEARATVGARGANGEARATVGGRGADGEARATVGARSAARKLEAMDIADADVGHLEEMAGELSPPLGVRPHSRDRHIGSIVRVAGARPFDKK